MNADIKELTKDEYLNKRKELLDELKALKDRIMNITYDLKASEEAMELATKELGDIDFRAVRGQMKRLEFKVQTEAVSLKHERALMKEIGKLKVDFKKTEQLAKLDRRLKKLDDEVRFANNRIRDIKIALDKLKQVREDTRSKEKVEKKKEQVVAPTVSLGEIVEIKRKK